MYAPLVIAQKSVNHKEPMYLTRHRKSARHVWDTRAGNAHIGHAFPI